MAENEKPAQVSRVFEQPPDFVSFYSDQAQVISTGNEVILQFYETIPGLPTEGGVVQQVRTRLRATIMISPAHASNIGRLLLKHVAQATVVQEPPEGDQT